MMGRIERSSWYAHVLVDEAQDLSPMQWRMLARRGRSASWTVVGDAAQASWGDLAEAGRAPVVRAVFAADPLPFAGWHLNAGFVALAVNAVVFVAVSLLTKSGKARVECGEGGLEVLDKKTEA